MDFVQIGCICPDHLESEEQRDWLESLDSDHNRDFVEVAEGDASMVYRIYTEIYEFNNLIHSDYCDSCYVAVDRSLTEDYQLERLDAQRNRSRSTPWSGMIYYQPVRS